jgi:hypothetical protein
MIAAGRSWGVRSVDLLLGASERTGVGVQPGLGLFWFKGETDGVDAPAFVCWYFEAFASEDVAEMGTAIGASGFDTRVTKEVIFEQHNRFIFNRRVERGPPATGVELCLAAEQLGFTGAASVHTVGLGVGVLAGTCPLCARLAKDVERRWIKLFAHLGIIKLHRIRHAVGTDVGDITTHGQIFARPATFGRCLE